MNTYTLLKEIEYRVATIIHNARVRLTVANMMDVVKRKSIPPCVNSSNSWQTSFLSRYKSSETPYVYKRKHAEHVVISANPVSSDNNYLCNSKHGSQH